MEKYKLDGYRWIRKENEQYYKGIKIETMRWYYNMVGGADRKHREFQITWKDGTTSTWTIKKGHTIKDLKEHIDMMIKYQDTDEKYKKKVGDIK